jgi:hypothetical protein
MIYALNTGKPRTGLVHHYFSYCAAAGRCAEAYPMEDQLRKRDETQPTKDRSAVNLSQLAGSLPAGWMTRTTLKAWARSEDGMRGAQTQGGVQMSQTPNLF